MTKEEMKEAHLETLEEPADRRLHSTVVTRGVGDLGQIRANARPTVIIIADRSVCTRRNFTKRAGTITVPTRRNLRKRLTR